MTRIEPIGYFHGPLRFRHEAPRQGVLGPPGFAVHGRVELLAEHNFEQAVRGLERFERIWLVYGFHRNVGSRAVVRPPGSEDRVGVFATRSPYRPSGLGLSCVRLERVRGLVLEVSEFDLLDGSPIYDIKPYVPAYDSFPGSGVPDYARPELRQLFAVRFARAAEERMAALKVDGGPDLKRYALLQLSHEPLDARRKRVRPVTPEAGPPPMRGVDGAAGEAASGHVLWTRGDAPQQHVLAFRMWRITFEVNATEASVCVRDLHSGYSEEELEAADDPYHDKAEHRAFRTRFGES